MTTDNKGDLFFRAGFSEDESEALQKIANDFHAAGLGDANYLLSLFSRWQPPNFEALLASIENVPSDD